MAPERGRVEVVYEYRTVVPLEKSNATVRDVLVGVDAETGEVLTVPAQSTPKLKAAREAKNLVRGAIMAAKEDVLDDRAPKRKRELSAIALAV
ncbi:hypothetical protein [Candidatus Palauibacter sp.]|uniref:hypothetical protein n=1 Tax=Candidatus Palauibacter sp. TaxID=3101350 RepID=UPI003B5CDAC4